MVNFIVDFYAIVDQSKESSTVASKGYKIGTKKINKYEDFAPTIRIAFDKTLPGGDMLVAEVTYTTRYRGTITTTITKKNVNTALTKIQDSIEAEYMTLDNLLTGDDPGPGEDPEDEDEGGSKPDPGGGGGEGEWGKIIGQINAQEDLMNLLATKANLVDGKVPSGELPIADGYYHPGLVAVGNSTASRGVIRYSVTAGSEPILALHEANTTNIDNRAPQRAIVPYNLEYSVRSVLSNVTTIPADTTSYDLVDASATTNNHSWQYAHTPDVATTYVFPTVTSDNLDHRIKLTIDFTNVQTYSFEDAEGNEIIPLFTPTITVGDVYEFRCEYSFFKEAWVIYPHKQGAVSDDYVMQSQVGVANGVAGLNESGLVSNSYLYLAGSSNGGIIGRISDSRGLHTQSNWTYIVKASDSNIDARINESQPIVPSNLNYAVTAALTDEKHITLTSAQQDTAQSVIFGSGIRQLVTIIPPETTEYTLQEGVQTHVPDAPVTYTLPAITDATRTHECVLTVSFANTQTIAFEDSEGNPIVPQDTMYLLPDDTVQYLCWYESLQGKWIIDATPLNAITPEQEEEAI